MQKSPSGKIFTAVFFIVYLQAAYKQGRFGSGLLSGWPTPSIFVCMINFALLTYHNSCFLTYCMDFYVRTISICTFFHMDILLFGLFTISIAMAKLLNFWHDSTCLEHVAICFSTCFDMFRHVATCFDMFRHVATCFDMFQHVATCCDMLRHVSTCSDMFRHASTCFNITQSQDYSVTPSIFLC